jgi:hypothetical protein
MEEFILRRSKAVDFWLINIPLKKAVEKLLITLLTEWWITFLYFSGRFFHRFPTWKHRVYQQFSKHSI